MVYQIMFDCKSYKTIQSVFLQNRSLNTFNLLETIIFVISSLPGTGPIRAPKSRRAPVYLPLCFPSRRVCKWRPCIKLSDTVRPK